MEYFSIGRVFSRAFGLIRDSYASVGLLVLIIIVIETGAGAIAQPMLLESLQANQQGTNPGLALFSSSAYLASSAIGIVGLGMSWAGGIFGLLQQAERGSTTLNACVNAAITGFLPTLGLIILWWLGVALGYVLVVIPALILIPMWSVAVPAKIGEGIGVFESFGRSRFLTRDHRLSIFGVLFLLLIVYYVLAIAIAGTTMGVGFFSGALDLKRLGEMSWVMMLVGIPISWTSGMLIKATVVSLYLETVLVKEGARTDALTDVFD